MAWYSVARKIPAVIGEAALNAGALHLRITAVIVATQQEAAFRPMAYLEQRENAIFDKDKSIGTL